MKTSLRPARPRFSHSFALISVLALVSLAALTATAFLAAARLERRATLSIANATRLEMALNAGSCAAAEMLDYAPSVQFTFVTTYWRGTEPWTNDFGYLLNGGAPTGSDSIRFYACFSAATFTNLDTNAANTILVSNQVSSQGSFILDMSNFMARMTNFATNTNTGLRECTNIPLLGYSPAATNYVSPPVGWVYIQQDVRTNSASTNTRKVPVARFAFYVQDLSGLIDAQSMGGTTNGYFYRAALSNVGVLSSSYVPGTNPEEISIVDALGTSLTKTNLAKNLTTGSRRAMYLSPGMLTISNAGNLTTNDLRYVTAGLFHWTNAWARIPVGLGYRERPSTNNPGLKLNLNNAPSLTVGSLAQKISTNLPNFANRGGAMNGMKYVSNIAANIVDYIDANSTPTVDPNTNIALPTWRGVEAIGWPNEVFTRFNLTARETNPPNYTFKLVVKNYIEVWNLSSTSVVVNGSDYAISNNLDIPLQCTNWRANLARVDSNNPPANETCTNAAFILPANSYGVISAVSRNFNIVVPTNLAPSTRTPMLTIIPNNTANKYTIRYKGQIIDATPNGRWLGNSTNLRVGDFHFITTAVNFGSSANGNQYNLSGGDPRGGLFATDPTMDFPYNQTTPGGRNSHLSSSGKARVVDPLINWPDGGHSLGDKGADIVTSPTDANNFNSITQGVRAKGDTNHYLQKVNDTGTLTNIMELGNVMDPIQWGDPKNPFHPLDTSAWMGLSNTATTNGVGCGRTTLRIGRFEHPRFSFTNSNPTDPKVVAVPNMSMSSAGLLDIFSIADQYSEAGRININTAPAPVLRALAGSILHRNDPAIRNWVVDGALAEAFAQGVMRFRTNYPFYSPSQLAFIGTDSNWPNTSTWPSNAVFGNTNIISLTTNFPGSTGVTKINLGSSLTNGWSDGGAEEWFANIYGLSTTYSRNFRCYVVAQLCDSNKIGKGPVIRKYYHIYTRQSADANSDTLQNCSASTYNVYEAKY